jgi:hypothetical protein
MRVVMAVIVRMTVARPVGMHVFMPMLVDFTTVDFDFARTASTRCTHSCPLNDFQFFDPHLGAAGDLYLMLSTQWAGAEDFFQRNGLSARQAPTAAWCGDDFEPRTFGQTAAGHRIKTKLHGLNFDSGKLTDFQPDGTDARERLFSSRVLDQLQHAFRQRHFMHENSLARKQCG